MKDPDAYQILVTRGKDSPWVAEIVCDIAGEVNITLGTGQTVMTAIESAWVTWRASHIPDPEGAIPPPEADVPLPFGD